MDKIIYQVTWLQCDPLKAFDLFTVNEHLEKWLTQEADVELKVGGKHELFWNPEDKEHDSTYGCKILGVHPGAFLCFEWKGPKQFTFMNEVRPLTQVVVSFIPCRGGTDIHLVHTGWRDTPEWEKARLWFDKAWAAAFLELQKYSGKS